jgi:uncharacterized protein (TIGR02246 family)
MGTGKQMTLSTEDAAAVEALYRRLLACWNERDSQGFAALFDEDGTQVGFDGSQVNGRGEIGAHLGAIFRDHMTATYVAKVREVRGLATDVALLRANVGMVPPGQKTLNPAANAVQSLVAVCRDGRWSIAHFHNTPAQFHGRPEAVQTLTEELSALLAG